MEKNGKKLWIDLRLVLPGHSEASVAPVEIKSRQHSTRNTVTTVILETLELKLPGRPENLASRSKNRYRFGN